MALDGDFHTPENREQSGHGDAFLAFINSHPGNSHFSLLHTRATERFRVRLWEVLLDASDRFVYLGMILDTVLHEKRRN